MAVERGEFYSEVLVKICGTRTAEAAQVAVESGADLIGMIMVPNLKRTVTVEQARAISDAVHKFSGEHFSHVGIGKDQWFADHLDVVRKRAPLVVGVFRNQSLNEILRIQREANIDIVQLHGDEPIEWAEKIPVPVIKKFSPGEEDLHRPGFHAVSLLDGGSGGEGQKISWNDLPDTGEFFLAGGLTVDNVSEAVKVKNVRGVDVSSGVESDGKQDHEKIKQFITNAKGR
ncbi:isomerase-domain-containing protein [Lipomyces japonicus]|uniref:isomerase-domain-containing protein n=1 Tax=Lipomyces japonicus TaxID=56871 RepID=UPI0034CE11A5